MSHFKLIFILMLKYACLYVRIYMQENIFKLVSGQIILGEDWYLCLLINKRESFFFSGRFLYFFRVIVDKHSKIKYFHVNKKYMEYKTRYITIILKEARRRRWCETDIFYTAGQDCQSLYHHQRRHPR